MISAVFARQARNITSKSAIRDLRSGLLVAQICNLLVSET
jgi:hypothetical protein